MIVLGLGCFSRRIIKAIGQDAMMFSVKPCHNRGMIGKRNRRIRGEHSFWRTRARSLRRQQMLGVILLRVIVAKANERD